ncbi:MAG: HNH endonuclease [Epibacterium sp.]|nr:HNH endonuclease [Epibacterium sp.]NQX75634.1 HNH endonuclease [Epibacterium sp.]
MPKLISPRVLNRLLDYNPETGELTWKSRPNWMFKRHHIYGTRATSAKAWNSKNAGKPALSALANGYPHGNIFRRRYRAHRVIMAMVLGEWPPEQVDHINGNRSDNRLCNLRAVDHLTNQLNRGMASSNKSGVNGVSWYKSRKKWEAYITINKKRIKLGYFETLEAAKAARAQADLKYGFTNHPST